MVMVMALSLALTLTLININIAAGGGDLKGCIGVCICGISARQGVRAGALRGVVIVPG